MNFITWKTELDTGIKEVDQQHKKIVEYINRLYDACNLKDSNTKEVKNVANQIIDYTISHFSFEEELLEKSGYTDTENHIETHIKFTKSVFGFIDRIEDGEDVADDLFHLLHDWLFMHILHEDAKFVPVVLEYQKTNGLAV